MSFYKMTCKSTIIFAFIIKNYGESKTDRKKNEISLTIYFSRSLNRYQSKIPTGCYIMQNFSSSRRKINLTTGIHAVFRGSNLFSNVEIGKIGVV